MTDILNGAYDLHVHPAPDVVERRFDDMDLARRYQACGMKGFAIKSHQFCTAGRAKLIQKMFPGLHVLGTVTLNNAVGGLNPMAVEMAARMGAKICWFPTVDSYNEYEFLSKNQDVSQPYGAVADSRTLKRERISILQDGKIKGVVYNILEVIRAHGMVLATGHLSPGESLLLISEANRLGIKKMVVTHGDYPATFMDVEIQKECVKCGAFIEHNYLQIASEESSYETAIGQIREIGSEHTIICSDGGQTTSIPPDEALERYFRRLLEAGFTEREVRRIAAENTAYLAEG